MTEQPAPPDWEEEGYLDGETASRTRGGTRGAEWNADAKELAGSDREDYITGFNTGFNDAINNQPTQPI